MLQVIQNSLEQVEKVRALVSQSLQKNQTELNLLHRESSHIADKLLHLKKQVK